MFSKEQRANTFSGIWFVALFAMASTYISEFAIFQQMGISPLIIGILLGMAYGNTLRNRLPKEWVGGIVFSTKQILRTAIVLFGFRVTFNQIIDVGIAGIIVDAIMVVTVFVFGSYIGIKLLKMDRDTAMLTSSGASICGAAAVLATDSVLKAESHKVAVAVATVVIFGTIAMFLYPIMFKMGFLGLDEKAFGIYIGATVHEVAHVVASGGAISPVVAESSIIVKMARVMLMAPFLIILGYYLSKTANTNSQTKILIPWFAVMFVVVAGFNTLDLLPKDIISVINQIDTFMLTMAMCALGMESNFAKFKNLGMKPFYLAGILFIWLLVGGYFITTLFV